MLPRGEDLIRGQLPGHYPGVARALSELAHVRLGAGSLLALAGRLGIQFQDQLVRGVPQLPVRQARRLPGEGGISCGGVAIVSGFRRMKCPPGLAERPLAGFP